MTEFDSLAVTNVEFDVLAGVRSMTGSTLSADALFELLGNERRRYLLYALDQDADEVASLDELAAMVLERERRLNDGAERPAAESEQRVRLSLHHKHLPKLEDAGLIEYDPRSETVRNSDFRRVSGALEEGEDEMSCLRSLFCASTTS